MVKGMRRRVLRGEESVMVTGDEEVLKNVKLGWLKET